MLYPEISDNGDMKLPGSWDLWYSKKRKAALSEGYWAQRLADELYRPITRKFTKRRVISNGIDEIWADDLFEMGKISKWNREIR